MAPLVNYVAQPLKKAAKIIEIQIIIAIYFREHGARVQQIIGRCGFKENNGKLQAILCNREATK